MAVIDRTISVTDAATQQTPTSRGRRLAAALLPALVAGVAIGLVMPRGPMTTGQSVSALLAAVTAGALAGWLLRSRWGAVLAPMTFAGVFELVRLGADGPTVDALRFDSIGAIAAVIAGRGFDALVILLPMAVAALWAAAAVRERTPAASLRAGASRALRTASLMAATLVVLLTAAALVRPATTEPVLGADGRPLPGSIAELVTIPVGGVDQSLMIRGADVDAPVLLFLEGGPGGTAVGAMRFGGERLEQEFVVATWDQRGTGRSADVREPIETLTVDQLVADTIEVTEYLKERFDTSGVYLVGNSWGTTLGVLAAQQRPDLFHAFVGVGQMVSQRATDELMYAESLAYAESAGDRAFADRLREIGPPPYDDAMLYPIVLSTNPEWLDYPRADEYDGRTEYPANLFVGEYTLTEQIRAGAGLADTYAAVYPQLLGIDFRTQVPSLEVPVYLVQGAHEAEGRDVLAREWFEMLRAPVKELVTFEQGGHRAHFDDPVRFAELMSDVLEATHPQ